MGKNIGDDLSEGKPTLPLIFTMREGTAEDSNLIRKAIRQGDISQLDKICASVERSGALDYTKQAAHNAYKKACDCLVGLPESIYKDALYALAEAAINRNK